MLIVNTNVLPDKLLPVLKLCNSSQIRTGALCINAVYVQNGHRIVRTVFSTHVSGFIYIFLTFHKYVHNVRMLLTVHTHSFFFQEWEK